MVGTHNQRLQLREAFRSALQAQSKTWLSSSVELICCAHQSSSSVKHVVELDAWVQQVRAQAPHVQLVQNQVLQRLVQVCAVCGEGSTAEQRAERVGRQLESPHACGGGGRSQR